MFTTEEITTVLAILGAFGGGAFLKSLLDHSLSRRDREAVRNESAVRTAESMVVMLEAALAKSREENEALKAALAASRPAGPAPHGGQ